MERQQHNATVRAVEDTECVSISRVDFKSEVKQHPEIAVKILSTMLRRVQDTTSYAAG